MIVEAIKLGPSRARSQLPAAPLTSAPDPKQIGHITGQLDGERVNSRIALVFRSLEWTITGATVARRLRS
jgi:hypothetical protein